MDLSSGWKTKLSMEILLGKIADKIGNFPASRVCLAGGKHHLRRDVLNRRKTAENNDQYVITYILWKTNVTIENHNF